MEKKYCRFLYGEMDGCFVHIGEIEDIKTGKRLAFGYIRSIDGHVDQNESEHTLFLCPKKLDVIILGNLNTAVKQVLKKFMEHAEVDTLVVPEGLGFAGLSFMSRKTLTLCLSIEQPGRLYRFSAAGWKLIAATYEKGLVVFAHGLSCTEEMEEDEDSSPYDLGDFLPDGYYKKAGLCVSMKEECAWSRCEKACGHVCAGKEEEGMHVCNGDEENRNVCNEAESVGTECNDKNEVVGTGCDDKNEAAGTMCDRAETVGTEWNDKNETDRAECDDENATAQNAGDRDIDDGYEMVNAANCMGTILLAGEMKGIRLRIFESELEENIQGIRFVGIAGKEECEPEKRERMANAMPDKRYFIGVRDEVSDEKMAEICGDGVHGNPVIIQEGKTFCCCGVVTYEE